MNQWWWLTDCARHFWEHDLLSVPHETTWSMDLMQLRPLKNGQHWLFSVRAALRNDHMQASYHRDSENSDVSYLVWCLLCYYQWCNHRAAFQTLCPTHPHQAIAAMRLTGWHSSIDTFCNDTLSGAITHAALQHLIGRLDGVKVDVIKLWRTCPLTFHERAML